LLRAVQDAQGDLSLLRGNDEERGKRIPQNLDAIALHAQAMQCNFYICKRVILVILTYK
jgi:hypothetical protein